jgi:hypothetical protein
MWARLDPIISPLGMFAKWRNGAPQTAAKEMGFGIRLHSSNPQPLMSVGSNADMGLPLIHVRFTPKSGDYAAICSVDVRSSFGVRVLSEDVDRNPAAKSKSL